MASDLPSSASQGSISFSQIEAEFGSIRGTGNKKLGSYRGPFTYQGSSLSLPLDEGVPINDSPISFNDFYGKEVNILVDLFTGKGIDNGGDRYDFARRVDAPDAYMKRSITVGPAELRPLPAYGGGKKVIVHVNKVIGSSSASLDPDDMDKCALRTGMNHQWAAGTELTIDVGTEGMIAGAGGNGGHGAVSAFRTSSESGGHGSSGLGIEYEGTKVNIQGGQTSGDQVWTNITDGYVWDIQASSAPYYNYVFLAATWNEVFDYYLDGNNNSGQAPNTNYNVLKDNTTTPPTWNFYWNQPSGSTPMYSVQSETDDVEYVPDGAPSPGNNYKWSIGSYRFTAGTIDAYNIVQEEFKTNINGSYKFVWEGETVGNIQGNSTREIEVDGFKYTRYVTPYASGGEPVTGDAGDFYKMSVQQSVSSGGGASGRGGGAIMCGYGGGGGGGAAADWDKQGLFSAGFWRKAGGGGGGGGAGAPAGGEGEGGCHEKCGEGGADGDIPSVIHAEGGSDNLVTGGGGGAGANNKDEAKAGRGGDGGDNTADAQWGSWGESGRRREVSAPGAPGLNGAAIRILDNSIVWSHKSTSNQNRVYGNVGELGVG